MIVRETFFVFVIIKNSSHFLKSPERVTIENKAVTYFPITKPKDRYCQESKYVTESKFPTSRRTIAITSGRFMFNHRRERYSLDDLLCLVEKSQVRGAPTLARASHHPPVARITQDKRF